MPLPRGLDPSHYRTFNSEDEARFYNAVLKGTLNGMKDLVEIVAHPIDNVLHPLYTLANDVAIIGAKYPASDDPLSHSLFTHLSEQHPEVTDKALRRMNARIANIYGASVRFMEANADQKTEMGAQFLTTILAPGFILKGIKATTTVAQNMHRFGISIEPTLYRNNFLMLTTPRQFKIFNAMEIKSMPGTSEWLYVITANRELLFCPPYLEKAIHKIVCRPWSTPKCKRLKTNQILHSELANYQNIYAAGKLKIIEGEIIGITPFAGDYLPGHSLLGRVTGHIFEKNGLNVSTEFKNYQWRTYPEAKISIPNTTINPMPGLETFATTAITLIVPKAQTTLDRLVADAFSQRSASIETIYVQTLERLPSHLVNQVSSSKIKPSVVKISPEHTTIATRTSFEIVANTLLESRKSGTRHKIESVFGLTATLSNSPRLSTSQLTPRQAPHEMHRFFSNNSSTTFDWQKTNRQAPAPTPQANQFNTPFFLNHQPATDRIVRKFESTLSSLTYAPKSYL